MLETLDKLQPSDFPAIRRERLQTLQVNLGYRCNQQCLHCHVAAGPNRSEVMAPELVDLVLRSLQELPFDTLDLTGGAPELNPDFRRLVRQAHEMGIRVIDRCNLTILEEPGQHGLAEFLAANEVDVVASLPCYLEDNVDRQRGKGVYELSIRALQRLNALGYGADGGRHRLDLVYNPQGPTLPPPQSVLESDYRRVLAEQHGIRFDRLLALANLPIQRFGSSLISLGQFDAYMALLKGAHRNANLEGVMCRSLISVDWQGYLYDCDFNQMLGLNMTTENASRSHLRHLSSLVLADKAILVADHCYGCTAGQGSSCSGALQEAV